MARNKRRSLGVGKCRRFRTFMIKKENLSVPLAQSTVDSVGVNASS
jgi:hypothetical protein